MSEKQGFISINRSILGWEWYQDTNVLKVYLYCLLKANHTDKKWRGNDIKRGQFLTSLSVISTENNLTIKQVRTALTKLKKTNNVASVSSSKNTIITVVNYNSYQQRGQTKGKRGASEGQTRGKQRATTNNDNNDNNDNKSLIVAGNDFDSFWEAYGKIGNEKPAKTNYEEAIKNTTHKIIMAGLKRYQNYAVANQTPAKFIKHASTWLDANGWQDEYNIHKNKGDNNGIDSNRKDSDLGIFEAIKEHNERYKD